MSETTSESTTTRKRSSSRSSDAATTTSEAYDKALEQGYFGGPADDTDYTAGADTPDITETSVTHELVPAKAAELQQAIAEASDPNKAASA